MGASMSLSDLASIGSFVSGIAVLVSLLFLYFQVRQVNQQVIQAERNQRALIQQGRAQRAADHAWRMADPELATTYWKGVRRPEDLSLAELDPFLLPVEQPSSAQRTRSSSMRRVCWTMRPTG